MNLQTHLEYSIWASQRLVDVAATLTPEELTRDFGTADKSVLGSLVHIYAADRVWMDRIEGKAPGKFMDPAVDMHLSVLENEWPALLRKWTETAATIDLTTRYSYRLLNGDAFESNFEEIVLHLVNHATHHRGQVSGFLRAMGKTPPPLDLIRYYRELAMKAAAATA